MRAVLAIFGILASCSFDGGVPDDLLESIDGGQGSDDAAGGSDAAAIDGAPGSPDAALDATVPLVTYSLVPTGTVSVQANFGGGGGSAFDDDCPGGRVVTGFDGDNTSNGICLVQTICSLVTANPDGSVTTSDPILGAIHGNSGSFFAENPLVCPSNAVVVAAEGNVSTDIVRQLKISCAPLTWDYATTTYGVGAATQLSTNIGSNVGTVSSGSCSAGQVAGGFGGSAGTLLDRFELHCFDLSPVAQ